MAAAGMPEVAVQEEARGTTEPESFGPSPLWPTGATPDLAPTPAEPLDPSHRDRPGAQRRASATTPTRIAATARAPVGQPADA